MQDAAIQIQRAFELLLGERRVRITSPLKFEASGTAEFGCETNLAVPNVAGLPPVISLRVVIPKTFPFAPVEVYSTTPDVVGFPHQDAESHKLCLPAERLAPVSEGRLVTYMDWALEWLEHAAKNHLLEHGDPYELPDFSRKHLRLPEKRVVWFVEDSESFEAWKLRVGSWGEARIARLVSLNAIAAVSFLDDHGDSISDGPFSEHILKNAPAPLAWWALLKDLRYLRHRPPQTFGELRVLCSNNNIALNSLLAEAWNARNSEKYTVVLIGFPVPEFVGGPMVEVHWQPLYVSNILDEAKGHKLKLNPNASARVLRTHLANGNFADDKQIPWGTSANVSRNRIYRRGSFSSSIQNEHIGIVGCGALGSIVAETLARGGVSRMTLFDGDTFHLENQCRHTLDGLHVGKAKAVALADRLSSCNPLSEISGFACSLPDEGSNVAIGNALAASRVLIDCTADSSAFAWMSRFSRETMKRFVHLFVNFDASLLTGCISGKQTSTEKVSRRLYADILSGKTPVSIPEYFHEPSKEQMVFPGAGCWHPTFPARNNHIWLLASAAIDAVTSWLNEKEQCDGYAFVLRREPFTFAASTKPAVICIWSARYR